MRAGEFALARENGGLAETSIPLLSDVAKEVSSDYGVLLLEGRHSGVAGRALFIISPDGILQYIAINDLSVGHSVDKILELLRKT